MDPVTRTQMIELCERLRSARDVLDDALEPVSLDDAVNCFHRARERVANALRLAELILERGGG